MERVILGTEGIALAEDTLMDMPLSTPRQATSPDDWGDEETVGLFVRRRGETMDTIGPTDWGQWAGVHEGEQRIILRACGPVEPMAVMASEIIKVAEAVDPYVAMRENAETTPILGVIIFDTVEEMLAEFWLD
jgi:hypothetical protein